MRSTNAQIFLRKRNISNKIFYLPSIINNHKSRRHSDYGNKEFIHERLIKVSLRDVFSYPPVFCYAERRVVGERGFEPRTSVLSGLRSNQLSYSPAKCEFSGPKRSERVFSVHEAKEVESKIR